MSTKNVTDLIKNLPKLRVFKLSLADFECPMEVAYFVGESFDKLEHFEMTTNAEYNDLLEYFKGFPHLKTKENFYLIFKIVVVKKI
jgi:hypothetical protein